MGSSDDIWVGITVGVQDDGRVRLELTRPVPHVLLSPEQALDLAEGIIQAVNLHDAGRVGLVT